MLPLPRATAAALYVLIDIAYVLLSKSTYSAAAKAVQGAPMDSTKPLLLAWAALAYGSMALAWYVLVAPAVERSIHSNRARWIGAALLYGGVFGLVLYGTFNGSNYALFKNWGNGIALRDLAWGVSWATLLTLAYAGYLKSRARTA
jgi:uncharacterized membrane protein